MSGINLGKLLESGEGSDLKIIVGPSKEVFNVHRLIVTFGSEFFKAALQGNFKEAAEGEINLPEQEPTIIRHALKFLYTGDYTARSMSEDEAVYSTADFLGIKGLGSIALDKLSQKVSVASFSQFDRIVDPKEYPHQDVLEALENLYQNKDSRTGERLLGRDIIHKMFENVAIRLHKLLEIYQFKTFLERNPSAMVDIMEVYHSKIKAGKMYCPICKRLVQPSLSVQPIYRCEQVHNS